MTHQTLHQEALNRVKDFVRSTTRLLEILEQIDNMKSYLNLGYPSLWSYVTVGLALSESQAQQFISVMRKSKDVPALKSAVASGKVSLPKAALIVSEIKPENQKEWLELAGSLTTRNLKEAIAKANPQARPIECITARTELLSELKLGLKKEVLESLKEVQNILSQKKRRTVKLDETLEELARFYLEKNGPLQKANRALCADKVDEKPVRKGRIQYPAWIRHQVQLKSQNQCMAQLPNGQRCLSKRFLEIHHLQPLSEGGSNHPDNLIILCRLCRIRHN